LAKTVKQSVAYNFGCWALYNLPCRASVSIHQVKCNIPTLRPYCDKINRLPFSWTRQKF